MRDVSEETTLVAVLAAGASKRMGAPKLLLPYRGMTLFERAIRAAKESAADKVVAITGAYHREMTYLTQDLSVDALMNDAWTSGQSSSVKMAVCHARAIRCTTLIVMVADQPHIESIHINALIRAAKTNDADAFISSVGERRGNPCCFTQASFDLLMALSGDEGARQIFRSLCWDSPVVGRLRAAAVEFDDEKLFEDIDTPLDFKRLV